MGIKVVSAVGVITFMCVLYVMVLTQGLNAQKTVTVSLRHNPSQKTTKPPATVRIRESKGKNLPVIDSY